MATADQVKVLVWSHAEDDDTSFYAIAMQVATQATRKGNGEFAEELVGKVEATAKTFEPARGRVPCRSHSPDARSLAGRTKVLTVAHVTTSRTAARRRSRRTQVWIWTRCARWLVAGPRAGPPVRLRTRR